MATNIFTFVNLVKGYGRLSKNKSAKKLDPSKADPNLDLTPDPPKQPVTTLPKGGKKTFLVTGAKNFDFTETHEKQLVRNFRNFEKKYGSAQIAHDYNPSNKTSAFVARVAKKHNLPTLEDRPISHKDYNPDPNKKEGFKNRAIAIQKGVDEGKIFRVSYSQEGKLSAVAPDKGLRDKWRSRLGEIKKEGKWRSTKFNKFSKNTQAYKPISAVMDEISDHPVGSKEHEAGLGYLREYNEDLRTRLNRPSSDVSDFLYRHEEGSLPKGHKLRFEIDDIADAQADPKPKTEVLVQKPKPPWRRDYFAKTPGLGKPKIVKLADSSDTSERRYVEKFEDAYDQGTTSDEVSAPQKKKLKPASKTILTGSKQQNIELTRNKSAVIQKKNNRITVTTFQKPDAYGSSSLTQFEGKGLEEPQNISESLDFEGESKDDTSWTKDKERKQNKGWDRHQKNWAEQQEVEFKQDIADIDEQKSTFKSIERQNKKLKKQGKPQITGKSLLTRPGYQRDSLKWDRQSKTLEHISDVDMPKETKAQKTDKTVAKVKEGAYGGKAKHGKVRYKLTSKGGNFSLKSFGLFSTLLTPFVAHKKAKKDLGRKPSTLEALNYTLPSYARKKRPRYTDPI